MIGSSSFGNCSGHCPLSEGKKCAAATITSVARRPCIFPFNYEEGENITTYHGCTFDHSLDGEAWCAVAVDENNNVENWGYCEDICPILEGEPLATSVTEFPLGYNRTCRVAIGSSEGDACQLPWFYNHTGLWYDGCQEPEDGRAWCPLELDSKRHYISGTVNWGYCAQYCPISPGTSNRKHFFK